MKIATWNLALPVSDRRREAMLKHTDNVKADIWVLRKHMTASRPAMTTPIRRLRAETTNTRTSTGG
jgi:hypothetical protein